MNSHLLPILNSFWFLLLLVNLHLLSMLYTCTDHQGDDGFGPIFVKSHGPCCLLARAVCVNWYAGRFLCIHALRFVRAQITREKMLAEENAKAHYEHHILKLEEELRTAKEELDNERRLHNKNKKALEHLRTHFASLPLRDVLPPGMVDRDQVPFIDHIGLWLAALKPSEGWLASLWTVTFDCDCDRLLKRVDRPGGANTFKNLCTPNALSWKKCATKPGTAHVT